MRRPWLSLMVAAAALLVTAAPALACGGLIGPNGAGQPAAHDDLRRLPRWRGALRHRLRVRRRRWRVRLDHDDAFHAAHRAGTHASHGDVPAEVTVPALETATTTITFEEPGTLAFICHLPAHESYGMVGTLTVDG